MKSKIHWKPGIYDSVLNKVKMIVEEMCNPDEILGDDVINKITLQKYPTQRGLRKAVYTAMLTIGYVRKLPLNTRSVEFVRADLPNGVYKDHEVKIHWKPGIYDSVLNKVKMIVEEMCRPDEILGDDIIDKILWQEYPTQKGLRKAVYTAMATIGYVRKLPLNTKKCEFVRADLPNGVYKDHEAKLMTYKQKYPELEPALLKIIKNAEYPMYISVLSIMSDLNDMGINARTRDRKTAITYLMPKLGYDIERDVDGRMSHKKSRIYYTTVAKRITMGRYNMQKFEKTGEYILLISDNPKINGLRGEKALDAFREKQKKRDKNAD